MAISYPVCHLLPTAETVDFRSLRIMPPRCWPGAPGRPHPHDFRIGRGCAGAVVPGHPQAYLDSGRCPSKSGVRRHAPSSINDQANTRFTGDRARAYIARKPRADRSLGTAPSVSSVDSGVDERIDRSTPELLKPRHTPSDRGVFRPISILDGTRVAPIRPTGSRERQRVLRIAPLNRPFETNRRLSLHRHDRPCPWVSRHRVAHTLSRGFHGGVRPGFRR